MTARDEVLAAARRLATSSSDGTFSIEDVVSLVRREGTSYKESTIRTHVVSRMCANAPDNHGVTYRDLIRTDVGRYRLS
jgi:hypothetical protein